MSGGVDSSVSVHLLKEAGYEVFGLTLKITDGEEDFLAAAEVASKLGFEHTVIDIGIAFNEKIIEFFIGEYAIGRTPNPCVTCNPVVKWRAMLDFADSIGARFVATGHYARISNGLIRRGADELKDQAYFLYRLPREYIERTLFPLGEFTKKHVFEIAGELKFAAAKRKESTEICFFPKGELREFLNSNGVSGKAGDIVDMDGVSIGEHKGWMHYTIGQRRGIGVPSSGDKLFVVGIDPKSARITLGTREAIMNREFSTVDTLFHVPWPESESRRCGVQIRHRGDEQPGNVTRTDESSAKIVLDKPLFAPAPGQSAVFFDGDVVIGGGIIDVVSADSARQFGGPESHFGEPES